MAANGKDRAMKIPLEIREKAALCLAFRQVEAERDALKAEVERYHLALIDIVAIDDAWRREPGSTTLTAQVRMADVARAALASEQCSG